ncbi:MAG TPA: 5-formyltetrahydrofolate cyclo-ligase [Acidimicrobiia bacterium]|nr:5-formyltetrahydrofolate cyclo-ligase [Acidimicrobiia bacterium]
MEDKGEIRDRMRGSIDPGLGFLVVSGLFVWFSSRLPATAAAYLAMSDEVDVTPLFKQLPGWRWVLPRVEPDGTVTFRDRDLPRERHPLGMEQPVDQGPVIPVPEIDVFLVPGVAFDGHGGRLGRGGGHYDRILAQRRPGSDVVGVTVEARVVEAIPVADHDQRVDWLATETGVRECSPRH